MTINALPKLSIITPSYNQSAYIEQTIRSVLAQNYQSVEHIVIDGGSNDGTLDVLAKYPHLKWVSEKDRGQADALNKGFAKATGDIIGWINSDDYYEDNIFDLVAQCFRDPATMWVIGNLKYLFDETGEVVPGRSPVITLDRLIRNPDIVRQQPTFFRRSFLERAGGWNPEYFMVMDFDLWVRLTKICPPRMVDWNLAYYRNHALQKTSLDNILRQAREISSILRHEHVPMVIIARITAQKRWYWIKGHIKEFFVKLGLLSAKYRHRPIRIKSGS